MLEKSVRLLWMAGMLISGGIFGFLGQWLYAALVWVAAFGFFVAAINLKNRKRE